MLSLEGIWILQELEKSLGGAFGENPLAELSINKLEEASFVDI
jgi:hypothetical protein